MSAPAMGDNGGEKKEEGGHDDETYQWRIPLVEWRQMGKEREYSPEFMMDGEKWRLLCFPRGNKVHPVPNCMAAYIELRDKGAWYRVLVAFKFRMIHPTDPTKTQWKEASHTFSHSETDRGFNDLVTPATLDELTHPDGCAVLEVSAWKAPQGAQARYGSDDESDSEPYDSKASTGFCGLIKQGSAAHVNSLVQSLYLLPKFRQLVYGIPIPLDKEERESAIVSALQRLFYALQTEKGGASTKRLMKSLGNQRHDLQDFCQALLDSVDVTSKKCSLESDGSVASLFEGKCQHYIRCTNIDFMSERDETFRHLTLDTIGCGSIRESIVQYVDEVDVDGYRVIGHGVQAAKKGVRFTHLPPILLLHLNRFAYDPTRNEMVKVTGRFEFPTGLDLTEFLCDPATGEPANPPDSVLYTLHSVLIHSGPVSGGRFYSYIRPFMQHVSYDESPWLKFDDESVTKVSEDDVVSSNYGDADDLNVNAANRRSSGVEMLIYVRNSCIQTVIAPGSGQPAADAADAAKHSDDHGAHENEANNDDGMSEDEEQESEAEDGKSKKKQERVLPQYVVPVPDSLTTRFKAEEKAEKARQEERKRAFMYMQLKVLSEPELLRVGAVGIDFETEQSDPTAGHPTYAHTVEEEIRVLKKATMASIGPMLAEKFGIPEDRQELWMMRQRQDSPRPSVRIDMHGAHGQRHIEDVMRELSSATFGAVIYLRDRNSHVRELARAPAGVTSEEGENLAATPHIAGETTRLILFKYFDIPTQKFIFLGSAHFATHECVAAVRAYCASLVKAYVEKQSGATQMDSANDGLVRAGVEGRPVRSISQASIEYDVSTVVNLTADNLLTWFELNGHGGKAFAFNPLSESEKEEIAARGRRPPDWNVITVEQMKVSNGEICLFNIKYNEEQVKAMKDVFVRQNQKQASQHEHGGARVISDSLQDRLQAASAQPSTTTSSCRNDVYHSRFASNAVDAMIYLARGIMLEFQPLPSRPLKKDGHGVAGSATVAEAEEKCPHHDNDNDRAQRSGIPHNGASQHRAAVVRFEMLRTDAYGEMMAQLAAAFNTSPDRIKLYSSAIVHDAARHKHHIGGSHTLDHTSATIHDVLRESRNDSDADQGKDKAGGDDAQLTSFYYDVWRGHTSTGRDPDATPDASDPYDTCMICYDAPPSAVSLCCRTLRVCTPCMTKIVGNGNGNGNAGDDPKCPNCLTRPFNEGLALLNIRREDADMAPTSNAGEASQAMECDHRAVGADQ